MGMSSHFYLKRARICRSDEDWSNAYSFVNKALSLDCLSFPALLLKCKIEFETGRSLNFDFLSAEQKSVLTEEYEFWALKGIVMFKEQQFVESVHFFKKSLELCRDAFERLDCYFYLIAAHLGAGDTESHFQVLNESCIEFERCRRKAFSSRRVRRLMLFAMKMNLVEPLCCLVEKKWIFDCYDKRWLKLREQVTLTLSELKLFADNVAFCGGLERRAGKKVENKTEGKAELDVFLPPKFFQKVIDGDFIVFQLYQNIVRTLRKLGIRFFMRNQYFENHSIAESGKPSLCWHTYGEMEGVRHLKEAYIPGYFYFDKHGYSGWAGIADWSAQEIVARLELISALEAERHFNALHEEYFICKKSKYKQKSDAFKIEGDYVFVALQVFDDHVSHLTDWDGIKLVEKLLALLKGSSIKIVIKRHPNCRYFLMDEFFEKLSDCEQVLITDNSIHGIIEGAQAVFTVNSGVGFEALLAKKKVFVASKVDYQYLTCDFRKISSSRELLEKINEEVDELAYHKFIYFFTREYLVRFDELERLEECLAGLLQESDCFKDSIDGGVR